MEKQLVIVRTQRKYEDGRLTWKQMSEDILFIV